MKKEQADEMIQLLDNINNNIKRLFTKTNKTLSQQIIITRKLTEIREQVNVTPRVATKKKKQSVAEMIRDEEGL